MDVCASAGRRDYSRRDYFPGDNCRRDYFPGDHSRRDHSRRDYFPGDHSRRDYFPGDNHNDDDLYDTSSEVLLSPFMRRVPSRLFPVPRNHELH